MVKSSATAGFNQGLKMNRAIDKSRLTQTQLEVAGSIISTLDKASKNHLILLEGLSGVGKSSLLGAIAEDVRERGGAIVEPEIHRYRLSEAVKACAGHAIVPFVPNEKSRIETLVQTYSGDVSEFLLKGMSLDEITTHIKSLPMTNPLLTLEQIAKYSLGVPLLAEGINHPMVTENTAERMGATYLSWNLRSPADTANLCRKYLKVEPTRNALQLVRSWDGSPGWYEDNNLASFLLKLAENANSLKKQGVEEPSPFFEAPESARMYEKMLSARDTHCMVSIYTPRISDANIARQICSSFGIDAEKKDGMEYLDPDNATRARLFSDLSSGAGWLLRKTKFLLRSPDGSTYRIGEGLDNNPGSFDFELRFISDFKGIPASVNIKGVEDVGFYFRKHEHPCGERDVSHAGWMVESLLQNLGVPYLANNTVADKQYSYNPAEKRIEQLIQRL